MPSSFVRTMALVALAGGLLALAGCGGGDSESEVVTETVTVTDDGFTDTGLTDTTETDPAFTDPNEVPQDTVPSNATTPVGVGETAVWNGNEFVVSDVGTSDEEPVADFGGETDEAVGTWLYFTVTPAEEDSGVWGFEFAEETQVRGGDGVVYREDVHIDSTFQHEMDEESFTVWVDVPEEAVSGAIFEVGDGIHTIDPAPSDAFSSVTYIDLAYATRVDLGQ